MTEAGNNYSEKKTQLHISVRNLVEFIFREGDIDNRSSRAMSADAMMEGTRIHRKIQGSMGKEYQAEAVSYTHLTSDEGEELGVIADVLQTGANDVYVVKKAGANDLLILSLIHI